MKPRLCTFIKPDHIRCHAFALTGSALCHAHKRLQTRQRRQYKALLPPTIRLGPLADEPSIYRALMRILRAIASNSIPLERSEAIFYRIMRAQARHNRAAALPALTSAHPLNLEPRTSNLEPFALPPAPLYNQQNSRADAMLREPRTSNREPRTSNLEPKK